MGSFGNARTLSNALINLKPNVVTLLPIGTEGIRKAVEDEMCALYLKGILEGKTQQIDKMVKEIMQGEGAQRLKRLNQEKDFSYCIGTDVFDIIPEVVRTNSVLRIRPLNRSSEQGPRSQLQG